MITRHNHATGDRCDCGGAVLAVLSVSNEAGTTHVYRCAACGKLEATYEQDYTRRRTFCGSLDNVAGVVRVLYAEIERCAERGVGQSEF